MVVVAHNDDRHRSTPDRLSHKTVWGALFVAPYVAVFLLFVVYPIAYGLYLGGDPASYRQLFRDPIYVRTFLNTLALVFIGVNVKLALAFLLSGFFFVPQRWIRWLFLLFILPWAAPAIPTFISAHWMLDPQWGLINNLLWDLFRIEGPGWLTRPGLAMGSVIVFYIWKWLPFWTLIFLAGRMAISTDIYEAAEIDGATGIMKFFNVTFPIMRPLYVTCTLLSTIWTFGDYNTVHFISGGGPALSTHVLATLGLRDLFDLNEPRTGVAVVITALPILIPLVIILMRQMNRGEEL